MLSNKPTCAHYSYLRQGTHLRPTKQGVYGLYTVKKQHKHIQFYLFFTTA